MSEAKTQSYKNALCFEDKMKITLFHNWYEEEFDNFFISFESCKNSHLKLMTKTKQCAPQHKIDEFMETNFFYILTQKTIANKSIYKSESDPHFNDIKERYYPLQKSMQPLAYTNIKNPVPSVVPIFEIYLKLDNVVIDDDTQFLRGLFNRQKKFLNVKSAIMISDMKSRYQYTDSDGDTTDPLLMIYFGF